MKQPQIDLFFKCHNFEIFHLTHAAFSYYNLRKYIFLIKAVMLYSRTSGKITIFLFEFFLKQLTRLNNNNNKQMMELYFNTVLEGKLKL